MHFQFSTCHCISRYVNCMRSIFCAEFIKHSSYVLVLIQFFFEKQACWWCDRHTILMIENLIKNISFLFTDNSIYVSKICLKSFKDDELNLMNWQKFCKRIWKIWFLVKDFWCEMNLNCEFEVLIKFKNILQYQNYRQSWGWCWAVKSKNLSILTTNFL